MANDAYHVAVHGEPHGPFARATTAANIGGRSVPASGPFSRADIIDLINRGSVSPDTSIWCEGLDNWAPASSFFEFSGHFTARSAAPAITLSLPAAPTPLDVSQAVQDGLAAFRRTPGRAMVGALVYGAAVYLTTYAIFSRFPTGDPESVATPSTAVLAPWMLVLLIAGVVLRAGFCLFTLQLLRGHGASAGLVFAGLNPRNLVMLVPYALLYGAAVAGGMLLLIVPGLFAAVGFSLGFYILMDSKLGPFGAMRASWRAVATLGWGRVFLVYLVSFLGVLILSLFAEGIAMAVRTPVVGEALQLIVIAPWTAATTLVIAAVYEQARQNQERTQRA